MKDLKYVYFHYYVCDPVWKDNPPRHNKTIPLMRLIHEHGRVHKYRMFPLTIDGITRGIEKLKSPISTESLICLSRGLAAGTNS
ncbi:MAG: hypothetical protein ACI9MF_002311 [Gammaproteobacteria bacterium]